MEIICPEHGGVVYVPGNENVSKGQTIKNLVIECPVCDEEVLISGIYDLDDDGEYRLNKDL